MGEDFYVILASNASTDIFPENSNNNFRIKLASCIDLDDNYLVSATEFSFHNSIPTFNGEKIIVTDARSNSEISIEHWKPEGGNKYISVSSNPLGTEWDSYSYDIKIKCSETDGIESFHVKLWSDEDALMTAFHKMTIRQPLTLADLKAGIAYNSGVLRKDTNPHTPPNSASVYTPHQFDFIERLV